MGVPSGFPGRGWAIAVPHPMKTKASVAINPAKPFKASFVHRRPHLHGKKPRQPADLNNQRCKERTPICWVVALADRSEWTGCVSSMPWALDHSLKFTRHVQDFRRPLAIQFSSCKKRLSVSGFTLRVSSAGCVGADDMLAPSGASQEHRQP